MSDLADKLLEELNCKTVFTIHTGFGDIGIAESVVITWVIMAAVFAVSFFLPFVSILVKINLQVYRPFRILLYLR